MTWEIPAALDIAAHWDRGSRAEVAPGCDYAIHAGRGGRLSARAAGACVSGMAERQMSERFELLDIAGDISGKLRLIYGSGPADPAPFVLTLTPQYVARALGKTPPVSFHEIEKYADDNAGDLREMALLEKGTGRLNLTLE